MNPAASYRAFLRNDGDVISANGGARRTRERCWQSQANPPRPVVGDTRYRPRAETLATSGFAERTQDLKQKRFPVSLLSTQKV